MSSPLDALIAAARDWMTADPDPETVHLAEALIERQDAAALEACFGAMLEFGTAGLRGRLGPGPGCMNRALVRLVASALGRYLHASLANATERGVVVGYDGRKNSRIFAEDTVAVLMGQGYRAVLFEAVCSTPELAHSVGFLGAAAGVMVTASHNPPEDNGYKVYWENGAQIIPPHDGGISAIFRATGAAAAGAAPNFADWVGDPRLQAPPPAVWEDYSRRVLAGRVHHPSVGLRAVYTAMHGVGWAPLSRMVALSGHAPLIPVVEQRDPDALFPTVRFPNPEEPGALDLALALARRSEAELILANDPDADRLAVAIPDGAGWRVLSGNEVGVLLADDRLTHGPQGARRLVATSIVSTSLLRRVADAHGVDYAETLTGFKWIANAAIAYPGDFVMGFEEALGYSLGDVVRDKDGVSAALAMLDLAAWCKAEGRTLLQHLESVYRRYGYAGGGQRSITLPGLDGGERIRAMMARLRASPPSTLGGAAVLRLRDLSAQVCRHLQTGAETLIDLPAADVLAFDLEDGGRVLARPSGTEPKIKFYAEVLEVMSDTDTLAAVEARGRARSSALLAEIVGLAS